MSQVGELVGETDTRLWRMLFRQVEAAYAEADFSQVCCVGVAERSVRKGHESISVFADLGAQTGAFCHRRQGQGNVGEIRGRHWKNTMDTGRPSRRRAWT